MQHNTSLIIRTPKICFSVVTIGIFLKYSGVILRPSAIKVTELYGGILPPFLMLVQNLFG